MSLGQVADLTRASRQQPQLVQGLFDAFIGGSWNSDILPGTDQDSFVRFEADVEKRDAVVKAFQVSKPPTPRCLSCTLILVD